MRIERRGSGGSDDGQGGQRSDLPRAHDRRRKSRENPEQSSERAYKLPKQKEK
jgi:hypothetical protein